jgi:hypothetical protein
MGIKEPLVDIVGVLFLFGECMMPAMVGGPLEGGILAGRGSEYQIKELDDRIGAVGTMGE